MKKMIGEGRQPLICTPLVGKTKADIMAELDIILVKQPDVIEWRADFFSHIASFQEVIATAVHLKATAEDVPFIFTIRSRREGGQSSVLSEEQVMELNVLICKNTDFEYVDCELSHSSEFIHVLRQAAFQHGTKIIGSFHNFNFTPSKAEIVHKLVEVQQYQLDVAKVAVMPNTLADVLTLLSATLAAKEQVNIPLITMSMGGDGVISRIMGGVFGSSLSFAVGSKSSAPGQIPIADLRTAFDIIEQAAAGK